MSDPSSKVTPRRRGKLLAALATAGTVFLAGCSSAATTGDGGGEDVIRLGVMGDHTSQTQTSYSGIPRVIELAVEQVNAQGGVAGKKVELVMCDLQGIPDQASRCARDMVNAGVTAVLAQVGFGVEKVPPIFEKAKIPYFPAYTLSAIEAALYEAVTQYVQTEMGKADELIGPRRGSVGFALTALQRRLASSPEAIYQSLRRRRERLERRLREEKLGMRGRQAYAEILVAAPDDEDDLNSEEQENLEETLVDQATAAQSIAELEAEIVILQDLEEQARRVVVMGVEARNQLFPGKPAIGATITMNGFPYTVIGVLEKKNQNSSYGSGPDNTQLFVPYSAMERDFPWWLVVAILARDVALVMGAALFFRRDRVVFGANWSGKLTTFCLGLLILSYLLRLEALYPPLTVAAVTALGLSYVSYGRRAWSYGSTGGVPVGEAGGGMADSASSETTEGPRSG